MLKLSRTHPKLLKELLSKSKLKLTKFENLLGIQEHRGHSMMQHQSIEHSKRVIHQHQFDRILHRRHYLCKDCCLWFFQHSSMNVLHGTQHLLKLLCPMFSNYLMFVPILETLIPIRLILLQLHFQLMYYLRKSIELMYWIR